MAHNGRTNDIRRSGAGRAAWLLLLGALALAGSACGTVSRIQHDEQVLPAEDTVVVNTDVRTVLGGLVTLDATFPEGFRAGEAALQYDWQFGLYADPPSSTLPQPQVLLKQAGEHRPTLTLSASYRGTVYYSKPIKFDLSVEAVDPLPLATSVAIEHTGAYPGAKTRFSLPAGFVPPGFQPTYAWELLGTDKSGDSLPSGQEALSTPEVTLGAELGLRHGKVKLALTVLDAPPYAKTYDFSYEVVEHTLLPPDGPISVLITGSQYSGNTVTFALDPALGFDNANLSYLWTFPGDTPGTSNLKTPSVTLGSPSATPRAGTLQLTRIVDGQSFSRDYTFAYTVVDPASLLPANGPIAIKVTGTQYSGSTATFALDPALGLDSLNLSYAWSFQGPGDTPTSSNLKTPNVILGTPSATPRNGTVSVSLVQGGQTIPRNYTFTYTVMDAASLLPANGPIPIKITGSQHAGNTVTFALDPALGLDNLNLSYLWSFPGDTPATSNLKVPSVTLGPPTGVTPHEGELTLSLLQDGQTIARNYTFTYTVMDAASLLPADGPISVLITGAQYSGNTVTFALDPALGLDSLNLSYLWAFPGGTPETSNLKTPSITLGPPTTGAPRGGTVTVSLVQGGQTIDRAYTFTYTVVDAASLMPAGDTIPIRISAVGEGGSAATVAGNTVRFEVDPAVVLPGAGLTYLWDFPAPDVPNTTSEARPAVILGAAAAAAREGKLTLTLTQPGKAPLPIEYDFSYTVTEASLLILGIAPLAAETGTTVNLAAQLTGTRAEPAAELSYLWEVGTLGLFANGTTPVSAAPQVAVPATDTARSVKVTLTVWVTANPTIRDSKEVNVIVFKAATP